MDMPIFVKILITIVAVIGVMVLFALFRRRRRNGRAESEGGNGSNSQVYIGNLSYRVTEYHLRQFFASFGDIRRVKVVKHTNSGKSKGFAFITFANASEAEKSLAAHGKDFHGRSLVVRIAKPR